MFDTIATTFGTLQTDLGEIITPVAVFIIMVLAVKMLIGLAMDDERAVKMSQRNILYTIVAVAIYYFAGAIVKYGAKLGGFNE